MTDLFTYAQEQEELTPAAARAEGIRRADDNAHPDWKSAAFDAVLWCARMRIDFTSDDVTERLDEVGENCGANPSALGPVFLRASREGHIVKVPALRPSRIARRHRDLQVWRAA